MADDGKGVMVVTVGLPGAGKTTICRALVNELSKNQSIISRHVCYDDVLKDRDSWNQADFCWKNDRRELYDEVASWLRQTLDDACDCPTTSKREVWLIIDDNMYYRSMRYQYYQLARQNGMGYAQIFIPCSIDAAVERNQTRSAADKISTEVIERMHRRLQEPLPKDQLWEQYSIFITDSPCLEKILENLWIASKHPAPALSAVDLEEKERQRQLTKESLLHQADLMLRRIISDYHRNGLGSKHGNDQLRVIKQRLLGDMKSGRLDMTVVRDKDFDTMRMIFDESFSEGDKR